MSSMSASVGRALGPLPRADGSRSATFIVSAPLISVHASGQAESATASARNRT
jgi:hypothetical protein